MIPKIIHYCWFGGKPLPPDAQKCIASWRKFFPDYQIKEWNENNFDVNEIPYTQEAYSAHKYAFVSDYARFKILYEHGGLYFDTDVEVIKSFDDILTNGAFMGCEWVRLQSEDMAPSIDIGVNPGLGIGAIPGLGIYKELIVGYNNRHFINRDGSFNETTIVTYTTKLLVSRGLVATNSPQSVAGITIYPIDYFNPLDDNTGKLAITRNTHSIHWYSKTWLDVSSSRIKISRFAHRYLGLKLSAKIRKALSIK